VIRPLIPNSVRSRESRRLRSCLTVGSQTHRQTSKGRPVSLVWHFSFSIAAMATQSLSDRSLGRAKLIFFLLGVAVVLPWNAYITAVDYFNRLYPDSHVDRLFSVVYMCAAILSMPSFRTHRPRTLAMSRCDTFCLGKTLHNSVLNLEVKASNHSCTRSEGSSRTAAR
jgi:hypothetical protein